MVQLYMPLPHPEVVIPSFVQPDPTLALLTPNTVGHQRPSEWICTQHLPPLTLTGAPFLKDVPFFESVLFLVFGNFDD